MSRLEIGYALVGVLAFLIGGAVRLGRMVRR
jgi:hypothetical protein